MEHTKEKRNLPARQDDIRARHIKRQKKKRKRRLFFMTFVFLVLLGTALFVVAF